ncbi:uncharacterized protein TRUGW13939_02633 [Talaromyces rugulosus]|uniref:RTA1 domain protein n=1 Tax=Talaromyces rugulosus TaxID=121627 RepID=A0A7H8QNV9_TALRU|nr:uncharacterized protein TRUGW13939_02633 [Talaromyces rugulosus]QKX55539.1 hypothetical protein TRUGW13939_02633 [Talaromyces rugulosus]
MDPFNCTLQTCSIEYAFTQYQPNIAANSVYLVVFSIFLAGQVVLAICCKSWSYSGLIICGMILEILGYIARILIHTNPFSFPYFLMNLTCIGLGPVLFSASIYLCLSHIVILYGEKLSLIRPKTYVLFFLCCDVACLALQGAGGAVTSIAVHSEQLRQVGTRILIAGLACQVGSLVAFITCSILFFVRVMNSPQLRRKDTEQLRQTRKWRYFLCGLATAVTTILTRSVFRVIELKNGFSGGLANDEVAFMILESLMVVIACIPLTTFHPGLLFGDLWYKSSFFSRRNEPVLEEI